MCAKFHLKMLLPTIVGIICCHHGNTLFSTVEKCVFCAQLHHTANMCAKFPFKCITNMEVVQSAMFPPNFSCHNAITMATHFLPLSKNVSCTSTSQGKHLCQMSWESFKNWGNSSRRKVSPQFYAIICCYHGNTLSATVEIWVLHIYILRQTSVPNFMRIVQKLRKYSSRRKIFPQFYAICHYHGNAQSATIKYVSCTSTSQGKHLCQISWKSFKNWGSTSQRRISPQFFAIICRYHGNTLSATVERCVLHIYIPRQTSVPNFIIIAQKLRK